MLLLRHGLKHMFFEPKSMFQRLFKHETIVFTFLSGLLKEHAKAEQP